MQESTEIESSLFLEELFASGDIEDSDFLKLNIYNEYKHEICSLLQAYGTRRGQVVNFEISEETFCINDNILTFLLYYDEFVYEGCKDMDYSNDDIEIKLGIKKLNFGFENFRTFLGR